MKLICIKSNKFISNLIMALFFIGCVLLINTTGVYAESLQNDKNVSSVSNEDYVLTIEERGGIEEKIKGSDIKLNTSDVNNASYDESLLRQAVDKLTCFDESKIIESKNPKVEYLNGTYVIRKEIYGTRVNKEILYNGIINAIKTKAIKLDLESIRCYEDPTFLSTNQTVVNARDTLNRYISSNIVYNYGGHTVSVDGSLIRKWISIDGNYNISLSQDGPREFVSQMASDYTNSLGISIPVSGGYSGNNSGWVIDSDTETNNLISAIKNGEIISKQPAYSQTKSASYLSNVGDTFVEIDMSKQYLKFYKNGYIVAEGNTVTGNISAGNGTPEGVYSLNAKQRNTSLIGPDYVSPVSFWMPFIGNSIGLHDASWRSQFGGEIYKTNGSHGCVNLPYNVAQSIYNEISVGTPVVCYY